MAINYRRSPLVRDERAARARGAACAPAIASPTWRCADGRLYGRAARRPPRAAAARRRCRHRRRGRGGVRATCATCTRSDRTPSAPMSPPSSARDAVHRLPRPGARRRAVSGGYLDVVIRLGAAWPSTGPLEQACSATRGCSGHECRGAASCLPPVLARRALDLRNDRSGALARRTPIARRVVPACRRGRAVRRVAR